MTLLEDCALSNNEGYDSPGVERKDSAGEVSNLTWGVEVDGTSVVDAILH